MSWLNLIRGLVLRAVVFFSLLFLVTACFDRTQVAPQQAAPAASMNVQAKANMPRPILELKMPEGNTLSNADFDRILIYGSKEVKTYEPREFLDAVIDMMEKYKASKAKAK